MIDRISVYESFVVNPYENLATEKYLLDSVRPGQCILYLWQNQNTVVIGKNQNPWVECRTTLLQEEGGLLARRLSGGGAVFHDLGNLNFTFLVSQEDYDLEKQLEVIRCACAFAGIRAEKSGRNDLLAEGQKFSGNAFYQAKGKAYHHGTLLIDVDMGKLSRYLSPPKAKLEAKGISSVRSRVVNLRELSAELTCDKMRTLMKRAFAQVYCLEPETQIIPNGDSIQALAEEYGSWEYVYGTPLPFTFQCEQKFSWGYVLIQLEVKNGVVLGARVYSDAMDWHLPVQAEQALTNCRFTLPDLQKALGESLSDKSAAQDLCDFLAQQAI